MATEKLKINCKAQK